MKTTAERLHEIMKEQNLKQVDIIEKAKPFAEKYNAKLTRPDLSQYCSGKVKPTQEKLFLLAAALNVNEAWLMGYDVPRLRTERATESFSEQGLTGAILRSGKDNTVANEYLKHIINDTDNISDSEYELIELYRRADKGTRQSVDRLLEYYRDTYLNKKED